MTDIQIPAEPAAGYGRPPLHTRFRPGVSGNPAGRPKRPSLATAALERALARPVSQMLDEAAQPEDLTEAIVNGLARDALVAHSDRAREKLLRAMAEVEEARAEADLLDELRRAAEARERREAEAKLAHLQPKRGEREPVEEELEDAELALVRLGAMVVDAAGRLRVRDWVIEAARARRPDLRLDETDEALLDLVAMEDGHDPVTDDEADAHERAELLEDIDDADVALVKLDAMTFDGGGKLRLRPWVIEAASVRGLDNELTDRDRALIAEAALASRAAILPGLPGGPAS